MKDHVLVQFVVDAREVSALLKLLEEIGGDFKLIGKDYEYETDESGVPGGVKHLVCGRIISEAATMIKLAHPWLADKMLISYISEDMKDQYRR